jgi:aspartate carbamoyltransferase catalytic subunit
MTKLSFKNLISVDQISNSDIKHIIALAEKYRLNGHQKNFSDGDGRGLILATLFFEASTRTRFSFESAMTRLGGQVITLEYGKSSSVKKGESLSDSGRVISSYADIIVMRHPQAGSVAELAQYANVPVINAGDGINQHPTQSLVDLYTIFCEKARLENLKIGVVGDLKHGRATRSFIELMSRYKGNEFTLISHPSLCFDKDSVKKLQQSNKVIETTDLEKSLADLDVLYVTRVQQERFENDAEYDKVKGSYRINKAMMKAAKNDMILMHPLPRVDEIEAEVDLLPQARYFKQAEYGVFVRMALLSLLTSSQK